MDSENYNKQRKLELLQYKNLNEFKKYIKKHEIQLKNLNNNNFDVLINAIEKNATLELLVWIIIHSEYRTLNYIIGEETRKTPLTAALKLFNFEIADFLINYGAHFNYIPYDILKPILNNKTLKYILNKDIKLSDTFIYNLIKDNQNTFLKLFFKNHIFDDSFILKFLSFYKNNVFIDDFHLNHIINKEKNKMLHFFLYAINVQNKTMVEYLIYCGIDINAIEANININLAKNIIKLKKLNLMSILIHNKFDMNQKDENNNSILNHAISYGNRKIIRFLIDNGADINGIGGRGLTPLTLALLEVSVNENSDKEIVKFLIEECGADIEKIDGSGYSPLTSAIRYFNKKMVKYLIDKGANINKLDGNNESPLSLAYDNERENNMLEDPTFCGILDYLIDHGANIEGDGYQNLVYAVKKGDTELVKHLINNNKLKDELIKNDYYSLFVMAIRNNRVEMVKTLNEWEYNIKYWEKVYNKFSFFYEKAPLFVAIRYSTLNTVKCVIECGADVITDDQNDYSHLYYAIRCGRVDSVKYILDKWGTKESFRGDSFDVNKNFNKGEVFYRIQDILNTYVEKNNIDLLHNYNKYSNYFSSN